MIVKTTSYFLMINGAVALTTSLATYSFSSSNSKKVSSLKVSNESIPTKEQKEILDQKKVLEKEDHKKDLEPKVDPIFLKEHEDKISNWGIFEKGLIIYQIGGAWGFKGVKNNAEYEIWRQKNNSKTYSESQKESFGLVYTVFPLDKLEEKNYSEFLSKTEKEQPKSKIEVMAELEEKTFKFKNAFGEDSYYRLILFINKFGDCSKNKSKLCLKDLN